MKRFVATPNDEGMRLSRFVTSVTSGLPSSLLYKSFRKGRVKLNGKRAVPDAHLRRGDVVELYLNDEFFGENTPGPKARAPLGATMPGNAKPPTGITPAAAPATVWENHNIAVLYKPAGLLCHSDHTGDPTLLDWFTRMLVTAGEYIPEAENSFAPALCNRLDRGTEGLVIAAKRRTGLVAMNALLRQGLVQKSYLCVTEGAPPEGRHTAHLVRNTAKRTTAAAPPQTPGAKPVCTEVAVLEQKGGYALCRVLLWTGRTHQIRAHLAALGAPLAGDRKYGGHPAPAALRQLGGQALCAHRLAFSPAIEAENPLGAMAGLTLTAEQALLPKLWQDFAGNG